MIFVKNEQVGKVKTRLADSVGDKKALEIYQKLLRHTLDITQKIKVDREVWYSEFIPKEDIWPDSLFAKRPQEGDDLGKRMAAAFKDSFEEEGYSKVVIIGSDCAELTTAIIEEAFKCLEKNDFVIGPAKDGGYYLLGMRNFTSELFEGISWSSETVFRSTIEKIKDVGASCAKLDILNDIDTIEDWRSEQDV